MIYCINIDRVVPFLGSVSFGAHATKMSQRLPNRHIKELGGGAACHTRPHNQQSSRRGTCQRQDLSF